MICFARLSSILAIAAFAVAANAQIQFTGSTVGRFNANSFTVLPNDTQMLLGLTFRGATFSDTTSDNFVAFGGAPANPNVNNFGSMFLNTDTNTYTGNTFTLRIMFTSPSIVDGDFFADIIGSVSSAGGGGVTIDFGGAQQFAYDNGTFLVDVDDLNVNPGLTSSITGSIRTTPVPEPASIAAIGLGVVALLGRRRARKIS